MALIKERGNNLLVATLVVFGVIALMFFTNTPTAHAYETSSVEKHSITPPSSIYVDFNMRDTKPGPSSMHHALKSYGEWYEGTVYKQEQAFNPDGPYYLMRYAGTLYKQ